MMIDHKWSFILVLLAISAVVCATEPSDPTIKNKNLFDAKRPLSRELEMSVKDDFKLSAVGDCIISRPLSQYFETDEQFARVVQILRQSDAAVGNLETTIVDMIQFKGSPYSWDGDWTLMSEPQVAKDLAEMGFDLFSRANNHAMDWGVEGMRETSRWLDQTGLIHAGAGENEGLARSAHYFETKKGRIAIVSMASSFRPTTDALSSYGASPGRPGLNALKLKKIVVATPDMLTALNKIHQTIHPKAQTNKKENLRLFGNEFEVGESFGYRYEMNPNDLAAILKNIRSGKQHSDFLIATIHSHETTDDNSPEQPADFLKDLAKASIDAGADVFMVTGHHHLGPIEIYRNRPIFYGLGNFFWSDIQEPLPAELHEMNSKLIKEAFENPDRTTDADLTNVLNARAFANELTFQTIIAESTFSKGMIREIVLHPVDLGYGRKLTESGTPRMAAPDQAMTILKRLQNISEPYGTTIEIENNLGVIRSKTP